MSNLPGASQSPLFAPSCTSHIQPVMCAWPGTRQSAAMCSIAYRQVSWTVASGILWQFDIGTVSDNMSVSAAFLSSMAQMSVLYEISGPFSARIPSISQTELLKQATCCAYDWLSCKWERRLSAIVGLHTGVTHVHLNLRRIHHHRRTTVLH